MTTQNSAARNGQPERFRVAVAQIDPIVGDIDGNAELVRDALEWARAQGVQALVTPEMVLTGYQAQDLILKPGFLDRCDQALAMLQAETAKDGTPALIVGAPERADGVRYNAAYIFDEGARRAVVRKQYLPNNGVFDEMRLFTPAPPQGPVEIGGVRVGLLVCEDAWWEEPAETLLESGAEMLFVINGSPFARFKHDDERIQNMVARVVETDLPLLYVNLAGAQDDQVFDGGSFCLNPGGALAASAAFFDPARMVVDFVQDGAGWRAEEGDKALQPPHAEMEYRAMVEAVRAYWRKNGAQTALLGLSGGIDSALTAAVAADALGPENLRCVMLPSQFTSDESLEDAADVAARLGVQLDEIKISAPVAAAEAALAPLFAGAAPDVTEENIQSRMRGLLLMALSNKTGALLLSTGNKSEVAVGYATLYGDMCGAYNPLKDLYKTRVFAVCRWRNAHHRPWMNAPSGAVIPERVIDKPPSAELRADQKDEDSLPPYDVLDAILEGMIELDRTTEQLIEDGYEKETVERVAWLLRSSEYKRFQSAPGPKLSPRAFWLERRYPLTNRFKG
ncbi:MAG: NAD+ synthase [Neomegalonema sp.]|nr:NAD+ synthase [Neomegalonema sp.]